MKFHWHIYPAPQLLFFQVTHSPDRLKWHVRVGHRQIDIIFKRE